MTETTKTTPDAIDRAFERKVRRSQWAMAFEQAWPRLWLPFAVAAIFALATMAGVWTAISGLNHKLLLGAFVLAFLASLVPLVRISRPGRETAIRRMERTTGLAHRPASSWNDTLALGDDNPTSRALWRAHRERLRKAVDGLKVAEPKPRTDRYDPFAVRALLLLALTVGGAAVGFGMKEKLADALRLDPPVTALDLRLDAWVTPPAYTSRPPIMLADGGYKVARGGGGVVVPTKSDSTNPAAKPASEAAMKVPEGSVLVVRTTGGRRLALELRRPGNSADAPPERREAPAPKSDADASELRFTLERDVAVRVMSANSELASWQFEVIPDKAPVIALTKAPEKTSRGALKLAYRVEDDYGVTSAEATFELLPQSDGDPATAWARPAPRTGPKPPMERPPRLSLRLPRAYPKKAEGTSFSDLATHPWAGLRVRMTLVARDQGGKVGKSDPIEMVLPERRFSDPLAKAVIEQRKNLVLDARNRDVVGRALESLTIAPDDFQLDPRVYLGLRSAYWRLQHDMTRTSVRSVQDQLWEIATRIEDGDLSDAERALKEAQERLAKALERGASEEEIRQLMKELREAMNRFLDQMARQAQNMQPMQIPQGLGPQQFMNRQDLEKMLQNLENMARSGDRDRAQQMLSELRELMDRMRSGRMANQGQSQRMMQMMREFNDLVGKQQQLLDDTFGEQRRRGQQEGRQGQQNGQRGQQRGQRGQRGQQGQQGQQQGQNGQQPGEGGQMGPGELGQRQSELRSMLERFQRGLGQMGMRAPGQLDGARESMEEAERALRQGNLGDATRDQQTALDKLRQGMQQMVQQMLRQMPSRFGMGGDVPRDPLGRPQRTDGPDLGTSVKVPEEIDAQRAREILEELRRRLGEPLRPQLELDYIERLLKRF